MNIVKTISFPSFLFLLRRLVVGCFLLAAMPCSGKVLVVDDQSNHHGFFSCFTIILGALDLYDTQKCEGVDVNFRDTGLYYSQEMGPNWWNYYFEPIQLGKITSQREIQSDDSKTRLAFHTIHDISRNRANYLINKYIHIKEEIQQEVDEFKAANFGDAFVIGVHYRGTDKKVEAQRLSYKSIRNAIQKKISRLTDSNYLVFVATDEKACLDYLREAFPQHVVCLEAIRSTNNQPIHTNSDSNYRKGKEALIDCLLLSECSTLIRTSSNLSLCSTYFNPRLHSLLLNPGVFD